MPRRKVHILNGDAIHQHMDEAGIEGDRIVWREVLCEGPVVEDVGSSEFWELRSAFFQSFFGVDRGTFQEKTIEEISRVNGIGQYEEVVCWFEYDLFCQVNMIALFSLIYRLNLENTGVFLICAGDEEGYQGRVGLGEMKPLEFLSLQENKRELLKNDLRYANQVWKLYCQRNLVEMQSFIMENNHACFKYLPDAIEAEHRRTRSLPNGLSLLEHSILKVVSENTFAKQQLIGHLLRMNRDMGFGDSQYEEYLKGISSLLQGDEVLSLSDLGKKVLAHEQKFNY